MSSLGARSRGGVVRLRCFSVARCWTPSGVRLDGLGWVPLGPVRVRQGPILWYRVGPYVSRTLIRDSRVIHQGSSGPVGPYRVPMGFRRNPVLARRDPTRLDGSLDCPVSVHDSCMDPYGTLYGGPTGAIPIGISRGYCICKANPPRPPNA